MSATTPAGIGWGSRIVMVFGGVLVTLELVALAPVLPIIEAALSHGPGDSLWAKQIIGIIGISIMIGAPLTGWLIDRIGMKPVLVTACLLAAVAGAAGLALDDLKALVFTRFLTGAAAAGVATCSMTLINTRLPPELRARWMGLHVSVYMGAGVVLYPVAGWLGEMGWRAPFTMYLVGIPLALIVILFYRDTPRYADAVGAAGTRTHGGTARMLDWLPVRFMLLGFLIGCVLYTSAIYSPYQWRAVGVTSPQTMSLLLSGSAIVPAVTASLYGRVRRRLPESGVFALGFALSGLGGVTVALSVNVLQALAGFAFYSIGIGLLVPNLMTALGLAVATDRQGRAIGAVKAAQYIANTSVPFMMEPFARQYGPDAAFYGIALLGAVMLAWFGGRTLLARPPATG